MDWKDNIVECNVWCYEDVVAEENTGAQMGRVWLPMIFDLTKAVMVKSTGLNESNPEINNMGAVYAMDAEIYVTDIPYEELKMMFEAVNRKK